MLRVNEIFYSIQGEGSLVGTPMIFLRLAGCNLRCSFCDTSYAFNTGKYLSEDEIVSIIENFGNLRWVCITGGEPLLQDITTIVNKLKKLGYKISLETNGTISIPPIFDHVVVSPKKNIRLNESAFVMASELKYIIEDISDFDMIMDINIPIFVQPVNNDIEIAKMCINELRNRPEIRLSIQIHKMLGVP